MNEHTYLRLVRFNAEAEEIHELLCVPEVYEYLADGVEPPPTIAVDWVDASQDDFYAFGGGLWALQSSRCSNVLGLVRLADYENRSLELTYLLHPSAWGMGYATRMAKTAMSHAFSIGLVRTVWAGADVANNRSVAVMKRLGMTLRRHVDYPAGRGVEYELHASEFDDLACLSIPAWVAEEDDPRLGTVSFCLPHAGAR